MQGLKENPNIFSRISDNIIAPLPFTILVNTNVFLFMNNKPMANFVREVATFTEYSATSTDFGNTLKNQTAHKDGATALTTDISGAVNISFQVPHEGSNKFRCGTHEIKILDVTRGNREDKAGSIARAIYTATGFLDTVHQDIESTRVLEIEGSTSVVDNTPTYSNNGGDDRHTGGVTIDNGNGNSWTNDTFTDDTSLNEGQGGNGFGGGWDDNGSNFGASDSF